MGTGAEFVVWDNQTQVNINEKCNGDIHWIVEAFALIIMCVSFSVLFQGAPQHLYAMTLTGCITYYVQKGMLLIFPYGTSTMTAALVLGLLGNAFAQLSQRPSSIVIMSGVLVLVPGK